MEVIEDNGEARSYGTVCRGGATVAERKCGCITLEARRQRWWMVVARDKFCFVVMAAFRSDSAV